MLQLLDVLLDAVHLIVIMINLTFWSLPGWYRRVFLLIFTLTWVSWLILGVFYGLGYCFLTDIHWQVKRYLGTQNLPNSYITYAFERFFGVHLSHISVYVFTGVIFSALFLVYLFLCYRQIKKK